MLTLALELPGWEFERSTFIISDAQPRAKTDRAIGEDEVQREAAVPIVQPFGNKEAGAGFCHGHKNCPA